MLSHVANAENLARGLKCGMLTLGIPVNLIYCSKRRKPRKGIEMPPMGRIITRKSNSAVANAENLARGLKLNEKPCKNRKSRTSSKRRKPRKGIEITVVDSPYGLSLWYDVANAENLARGLKY